MKATIRWLLWFLAVLVASLPATFVITFLLSPFWSWIERDLGVESMGHSGPAEWCFCAVYLGLVMLSTFVIWLIRRGGRSSHTMAEK